MGVRITHCPNCGNLLNPDRMEIMCNMSYCSEHCSFQAVMMMSQMGSMRQLEKSLDLAFEQAEALYEASRTVTENEYDVSSFAYALKSRLSELKKDFAAGDKLFLDKRYFYKHQRYLPYHKEEQNHE